LAVYCVVGLGNPGEEYSQTRHNLGFRIVDKLAEDCSTRIRRSEFRALTATVWFGRSEVLLMKPQTYMNLSGRSVDDARSRLSIPAERIVVVCDDADLELGRIRVRAGGGTGGHRGLRSIIEEIGDAGFVRIRAGVGRPPTGGPLDRYVLANFENTEFEAVDSLVERGAAAVREVVTEGVESAMRSFNGPIEPKA
jgi:PTH1 family peptidyl-tRNA hydrolase